MRWIPSNVIAFLLATVMCIGISDISVYGAAVPGTPILHYSFDNAADPTHDDSGNGLDLTIPGTYTSIAGMGGSALAFDFYQPTPAPNTTSSPYGPFVSTDLLTYPGSGGFTAAAWSRVDAGNVTVVRDYWQHTANGETFVIRNDADSAQFSFDMRHDFGATTTVVATYADTSVTAGQWIHLAGVFDPVGNAMRLYVNGDLAAQAVLPAPMRADLPPYLYAAGSWHSTQASQLDEVVIYDRALSLPEIEALAAVPEPAAATVLLLAASILTLHRRVQAVAR